ncbi:MAG: hypothetical protein JWO54_726 [Candidatus Saccharibacteria bacterium]|nr:hypothetical protein [Candidatus Saccharibacteria bacterium]MDB5180963.1 hypothetical protein [Candidatus Saccharibacteria bacterium]
MSPVVVTLLIVASSILTVVAVVPYLIAVVRRKTKPRIVSWFIWSLLTGISAVASYSDQQYPSGILLTVAALGTLSVVVLGWRFGDKEIGRLDLVCLIGALVGVLLWQVFDSPALAILAAVTIDIIGGIPTWFHIWRKPHEETAITFALSFLGAFCTLLASQDWKVTAIAYPLYLVLTNLFMASLIYIGQHRAYNRNI